MKRLPAACPLGEAEVVEVRRVERFEIDVELHGRLVEDVQDDPAQLEAVGAEQRLVADDDDKDVRKGYPDVRGCFVLRRDHVGDVVDEQVEREIVEAGRWSASGALRW